jgi:hypothetical protein
LSDHRDYDLFMDRDLESLRVRDDRNKDGFGANRLPVSLQTREAQGTVLASAVLQNFARGPFGCDQ